MTPNAIDLAPRSVLQPIFLPSRLIGCDHEIPDTNLSKIQLHSNALGKQTKSCPEVDKHDDRQRVSNLDSRTTTSDETEDLDSVPNSTFTEEKMEPTKRFACPYFKHDPKRFKNRRTCVGPGFQTIHRLKEHLNRKHAPSKHSCSRCLLPCKSASELLDHLRSPQACEIAPERRNFGQMTVSQQVKLRTKKRSNCDLTEEDKWTAIYHILFPRMNSSSIPSPYYLDEEELRHGSSDSSSTADFSARAYEDFLNGDPPNDLAKEFREEIRRVIDLSGDRCDWVEQIFDMAWRLPILTLKRYEQLGRL